MEVTVKAYLQRADDETEVRRVSMQLQSGSGIFKTLESKVAAAFPGLSGTKFCMTWQDSDEDLVTMSTDEELQEALSACASNVLKVFIADFDVSAVQDDLDFEILDDMEGTRQKKSLPEPEVYRPDHNIECPPGPQVDFSYPGCPPFMGPPPHMGPPPPCEPCGPYPPMHPRMIFGRRGRFGRQNGGGHGWMKMGRRQNRPYAGPWMMHEPSSWQFAGPFAGRMGHGCHGRHHDKKRHCEGKDGDKHGYKKALRESVPVSHRRWAKLYIHNWRSANIKNSTTTTSGSDTEKGGNKLTKEMAGVPEAYVVWLDMVLPRFHRSWENDANRDWTFWDEGGEGEADILASIKMSVPVEFRKWAWWFMAKRYGKRSAPQGKFGKSWGNGKTEGHRGHVDGKHWKCEGKGFSGGGKMQYMASQVPKPVRRWAKRFILTWRVEHQLPTIKSGIYDSDDDFTAENADVPEDYGKWLQKFLGRWHMWRSLIDSSKVETSKGGMEQFKDTVPSCFRMWIKCYLCRQFAQASSGAQGENGQYQKWVQIFKKKWLQMTAMGTDIQGMTSSEGEGAFSSDSDMDDQDVNTSFKRMKLNGKGDKNVKFAKAMDSDDSECEGESRVKKIRHTYPGFPRFARSELFSWDGISLNNGGDVDEDGPIPPNVYTWLCRVMTKMQWKKIKQMHKVAKKETKLARKELKLIAKAQKHNNA